MTLYVFGNEYLEDDSMARAVAAHLDTDVVHCRSPEDLLDAPDEITILDVVANTDRPLLLTDVHRLRSRNLVSLHDFDLAFFLKFMDAIGMPKSVRIIGVPAVGDASAYAQEVHAWL